MRFPRLPLLARLPGPEAGAGCVVLEAPSGYGKSWLARKVAPRGSIRAKDGDVSVLSRFDGTAPGVVIDDAHLLSESETERLIEFIEDVSDDVAVVVAGRYLPRELFEVAKVVDGVACDVAALSITAEEISDAVGSLGERNAERLATTAEGSVHLISAVLDQHANDPATDPVIAVHQLERTIGEEVLRDLKPTDADAVRLLARAPMLDHFLLEKLGGPGFPGRIVAAGVPLRRLATGGLELGHVVGYRSGDLDPPAAKRLATELVERGRPIDAADLLIDAEDHAAAADLLADQQESVVDTVEPQRLLALLARLGGAVDATPRLLLMRAFAWKRDGRLDRWATDVESALEAAALTDAVLRRKFLVQRAEALCLDGRADEAEAMLQETLRDLGPGEDRTLGAAHTVLAEIASSSDNRHDLQRADEFYRSATAAWESCGELARARLQRRHRAMDVLVPLGRFDEALDQIAALMADPDLSDLERTWLMVSEGFVLYNANRLDSAMVRFDQASVVGRVNDDARLTAVAAWGRALVAAQRDDLAALLRNVGVAENAAMHEHDTLLGLAFYCDVATRLGAQGELELADRYLAKAGRSSDLLAGYVRFARFVLDARRGRLGDVRAQLDRTAPAEQWRVLLVAALCAARDGDLATAAGWRDEMQRELVMLGFTDAGDLGERRAVDELQALLDGAETAREAAVERPRPSVPAAAASSAKAARGRRLCVIGGPVRLVDDGRVVELPAGIPQKLAGAVAAFGGSASVDQLGEALWPGEDVTTSRTRLRNVLLRLRRGAGDVVVRSGSGVRLADDVSCDLNEFEQKASDTLATARNDPDFAGRLAAEALAMWEGGVFPDYEYEEWVMPVRDRVDRQVVGLLDLLSIQAEDDGDLPGAQALSERALRIDRYSDSRYVRLAELLSKQGRSAAAVAVLSDAGAAAKEIGGTVSEEIERASKRILRDVAAS